MTALTFWKLPDEIKGAIFEYDDTYQKKMKESVLEDMWRTCWVKFRNDIGCPYCQVVLDHLFDLWGVYEDSGYGTTQIYWHKRNYFPDDFRFEISCGGFCRNMGVTVKVFSSYSCVFDGWVLNQEEQGEADWLDNQIVDNLNTTDVHWDHHEKLYVWQKMY